MDLHVLENFLVVAEMGNITRAAERLHISQPTISRQLMELERELGKTLLHRTNKSIRLTPDGMLFRETARDMLSLYQKAKETNTENKELIGDIYLGAGETESFGFLAEKIKAFRILHPKVCFHIFSENAERICENIDKGILDFGFIMRSSHTENYDFIAFDLKERWGVLVRQSHPLTDKGLISASDLRKETLILPENSVFKKEILNWIGGKPMLAGTYTLIRNALVLAKKDVGSIVCLRDTSFAEDGFAFLPFDPPKEVSPLLIWKKEKVFSPAGQAFLHFCNTEYE